MATDLAYARVTGRLGVTESDGPDPDDLPEPIWCDEGIVRIIPLQAVLVGTERLHPAPVVTVSCRHQSG